jgi:hypothetical protein
MEAKAGKDVERYERAVDALMEFAPNEPEAVLDPDWVERTQKAIKAEMDRLEHELKGYKNNLIKESIRVSLPVLSFITCSGQHTNTASIDGKRRPRNSLPSNWRPELCVKSLFSNERLLHHP